eukprot:7142333-Prorocentrum_lima.AAC.1
MTEEQPQTGVTRRADVRFQLAGRLPHAVEVIVVSAWHKVGSTWDAHDPHENLLENERRKLNQW